MTYFMGNISIPATTKYVEKLSDTVTTFSVAENYKDRNGKDHVEFYRISIFGKRGKNLAQYLTSGRSVLVTGRVKPGAYINKDNEAVAYLQMTNARIQFATGAKKDDPTEEIPVDAIEVEGDEASDEEGPF